MQGELHIGVDAEKVVVSPYPLRMRDGRATRRRTGSVTEVLPVRPSGRSREARVTITARVALPLMIFTAFLYAIGLPWWLPATGSVAAVVLLWRRLARASRPGRLAVPADRDSRVLWSEPERVAYERAVVVSRRIRHTWPALPDMIDPAAADRSLTRALADLAGQMARRQEIRRLRAELQDVREQRIGATARAAEQVLATLVPEAPPAEAAPELAARTEAVITAYRELEVI